MFILLMYLVIGGIYNLFVNSMMTEEEINESYKIAKLQRTDINEIGRQLIIVVFWPICFLIMAFIIFSDLMKHD